MVWASIIRKQESKSKDQILIGHDTIGNTIVNDAQKPDRGENHES